MSLPARDYLRHVLDEADYLLAASAGVSKDQFLQDETLKRAVVRSIEVIGEAVKQVPSDFRDNHATIPWKAIAGMRDRLIHGYFGVDYEIVWDVVQNKIEPLRRDIEKILEQES